MSGIEHLEKHRHILQPYLTTGYWRETPALRAASPGVGLRTSDGSANLNEAEIRFVNLECVYNSVGGHWTWDRFLTVDRLV